MKVEFHDISVPTDKLNAVVSENLAVIKKLHKKTLFRRVIGGCAAAAASIAVLVGVCAMNPVLAEKFSWLGEIFGLVQEEQIYPGDYSEHSDPVPGTSVSESDGVTITLSEFVCTTESLNVSVLIESEEPFDEDFKYSVLRQFEGVPPYLMLVAEQSADFADQPLDSEWAPYIDVRGDFLDDNTFAGALRIDFNLYPYAMYTIPDTFTWNLKVTGIICPDKTGNTTGNLEISGEWNFSCQITRQQDLESRTIEVNQYAPNGTGISTVTVTPYEVAVEYIYDETMIQPGYEESADTLQSVMLDGSGKQIQDKVGLFPADGYDLSKITVYYVPTPTEESWMVIQEKLIDESFAPQLQTYLEDIAVSKIEIPLQ